MYYSQPLTKEISVLPKVFQAGQPANQFANKIVDTAKKFGVDVKTFSAMLNHETGTTTDSWNKVVSGTLVGDIGGIPAYGPAQITEPYWKDVKNFFQDDFLRKTGRRTFPSFEEVKTNPILNIEIAASYWSGWQQRLASLGINMYGDDFLKLHNGGSGYYKAGKAKIKNLDEYIKKVWRDYNYK